MTTRIQEPAGVQFDLNSSHVGNISAIGIGRLHQFLSGRANELLRLEQDGAPSRVTLMLAPEWTERLCPLSLQTASILARGTANSHQTATAAYTLLWSLDGQAGVCPAAQLVSRLFHCGARPQPVPAAPLNPSRLPPVPPAQPPSSILGASVFPLPPPLPPMTRPPQGKCGHPRDPPHPQPHSLRSPPDMVFSLTQDTWA